MPRELSGSSDIAYFLHLPLQPPEPSERFIADSSPLAWASRVQAWRHVHAWAQGLGGVGFRIISIRNKAKKIRRKQGPTLQLHSRGRKTCAFAGARLHINVIHQFINATSRRPNRSEPNKKFLLHCGANSSIMSCHHPSNKIIPATSTHQSEEAKPKQSKQQLTVLLRRKVSSHLILHVTIKHQKDNNRQTKKEAGHAVMAWVMDKYRARI